MRCKAVHAPMMHDPEETKQRGFDMPKTDKDIKAGVQVSKKSISRRDLIKTITIGGSALTITKWHKPIVESVVLPAHAQASLLMAAGSGSGSSPLVGDSTP